MEEIKKEVDKEDHWLKEWTETQDTKEDIKVVRPAKLVENWEEEESNEFYSDDEEVKNKIIAKKDLPSDRDESATDIISPKDDAGDGKELQPEKKRAANITRGFQRRHEQRLELDKMLSELCQGASVSNSLSNLCRFQCQECHDSFGGWQALKRHVGKMHPHIKLTLTEAKPLISKTICHICKICSASLLCDTFFIRRHLLYVHNMYIGQYRKKFGFCTNNDDADEGKELQSGKKRPAKKTKGKTSHDQRLELDEMLSELCQGAPVSDSLSNLCRFRCQECHESFRGWLALRRHVAKLHPHIKLTLAEVKLSISKIICHICKICSASLLGDTVFIYRHLLHVHNNMYINQYRKVFGFTKHNASEISYSDKVVGNLCVYKCVQCGKKFWSEPSFAYHLKTHCYCKYYKSSDYLLRSVYHKCKLCNEEILCDQKDLSGHFQYHHQISLKEYCNRSGCLMAKKINFLLTSPNIISLKLSRSCGYLCTFSCKDCSKRFSKSGTLKWHLRNHKPPIFSKPLSKFLVHGFSYQCEKCYKLLLCDRGIISEHMKQSHGISNRTFNEMTSIASKADYEAFCSSFIKDTPVSLTVWNKAVQPISNIAIQEATTRFGNLCSFICPWCDLKDFGNWDALRRHCKAAHSCGISYSPSLVSVARSHKCLLCPRAVLNDRHFIFNHLHLSHKINLSEYEKKALQIRGEFLPTYQSWIDSQRQDK